MLRRVPTRGRYSFREPPVFSEALCVKRLIGVEMEPIPAEMFKIKMERQGHHGRGGKREKL
jgi:hypothetical protein